MLLKPALIAIKHASLEASGLNQCYSSMLVCVRSNYSTQKTSFIFVSSQFDSLFAKRFPASINRLHVMTRSVGSDQLRAYAFNDWFVGSKWTIKSLYCGRTSEVITSSCTTLHAWCVAFSWLVAFRITHYSKAKRCNRMTSYRHTHIVCSWLEDKKDLIFM